MPAKARVKSDAAASGYRSGDDRPLAALQPALDVFQHLRQVGHPILTVHEGAHGCAGAEVEDGAGPVEGNGLAAVTRR